MPGTPKTTRQPPTQLFENYVLTRVTSPEMGLTSVPLSAFNLVPGNPGTGYTDDGLSDLLPIGFDFPFDGTTYRRFVVDTNGWLALVDPTETSSANVLNNMLPSSSFQNQGINLSNSTLNVLLCPWFDDLRNTASSLTSLSVSADRRRRIQNGIETAPKAYRPSNHSVRYYNDDRSSKGRRLVIRWSSLSDYNHDSSVLNFEVVLYENGAIEFRYAPRTSFVLSGSKFGTGSEDFTEGATVGVFASGSNRFRDFALGLGHYDNRPEYQFGGATYNSSYSDAGLDGATSTFISRPYAWRLIPTLNWPASNQAGSIFTFSPPKNRRRVLSKVENQKRASTIRLPTVARTGDRRLGTANSMFDDRRMLVYTNFTASTTGGVIVDFPTTLPRFYGNSVPGVIERQDLFGGFVVTASTSRCASEGFIDPATTNRLDPFNETAMFENTPSAASDEFFVSGSSLDVLGDGLAFPLKSKTHVKLSLPVLLTTTMFGVSSSIYYYNHRNSAWLFPRNSMSSSKDNDTLSQSDIGSARADSPYGRIIEDARGFGPIGNFIASGNIDRAASVNRGQSDASIGASFSFENLSLALGKSYPKSVTSNSSYRANDDEVFSLPINQPFLIEKAVIELPIAAGAGWFNDTTTCFQPLETTTSASFDFAGPGLTVALFNQVTMNDVTQRDVIFSGTITHSNDNTSSFVLSNFPSFDTTYQLRPQGFLAFGQPAGVVQVVTSFTGTVTAKCLAQAANGIVAKFNRNLMTSLTASVNQQAVLDLLNAQEIVLSGVYSASNFNQSTTIAYVNPLGRAGGGSPTGRAALGNDLATFTDITSTGKVKNPFYVPGAPKTVATITNGTLPGQFIQAIQSGTNFNAYAAIPMLSSTPSPYLVHPGDKLVLAVSKTRPFFFGSNTTTPGTSGSLSHDIQLLTGSINVTLYGSLLRCDREYHDTLNQPLASDAIHEVVVGNEPVIDQYETSYLGEYSGSLSDSYITGSLVTKSTTFGAVNLVTGSRGRVFSRLGARTAGFPSVDSQAFNFQRWSERAGSVRVLSFDDASERYWDSMMPNIVDCFAADGTAIWIDSLDNSVFGDSNRIDKRHVGYIFFDLQFPSFVGGLQPGINGNWTWAYPFEPRYSAAARQKNFANKIVATKITSGSGATLVDMNPVVVNGFFFGPVGYHGPLGSDGIIDTVGAGDLRNYLFSDISRSVVTGSSAYNLTGSASTDDIARGLYGFGDLNVCYLASDTGPRVGSNHFAGYRNIEISPSGSEPGNQESTAFVQSPLIRGWKYGVYSGIPAFSKAYFRRNKYGQFRDMLEQRPYTKFFQSSEKSPNINNFKEGQTLAVVDVRFVDALGRTTDPARTVAQNLSTAATSSVPYFDGQYRNRAPITASLNAGLLTLNVDNFSKITL